MSREEFSALLAARNEIVDPSYFRCIWDIAPHEEKLKSFGDGEWNREPDQVEFDSHGFDLRVSRVLGFEDYQNEYLYGGHLCGYMKVPENHPWYKKSYHDIECDVHGGLTFGDEFQARLGEGWWIGFDCAHGGDYRPSHEYYMKNKCSPFDEYEKKMKLAYPHSIFFNKLYKSINFAIKECVSMAKQAKAAKNISK